MYYLRHYFFKLYREINFCYKDFSVHVFPFLLKSKTNLINLRKFNSHLQYYKINSSSSIKLHKDLQV